VEKVDKRVLFEPMTEQDEQQHAAATAAEGANRADDDDLDSSQSAQRDRAQAGAEGSLGERCLNWRCITTFGF